MTEQPAKLTPVETSVHVPLRPRDAFRLFTEKMEDWWPLETHSLSAGEGELPAGLSVEPREGGQIRETRPDGTQASWGQISTWQPGERLGIRWHVGRGEDEATEVEVTFTPTDTGTIVHLVHSGFEQLGAGGVTAQASYSSGWQLVLGRFQLVAGRMILA
ncbi:SRPBCC domain-containing protein [Pseudoroseicyclus sp. H15]